jgi:hypothetical protein
MPSQGELDEYFRLRIHERLTPAQTRRQLHIHYREAASYERTLRAALAKSLESGGAGPYLPPDRQGEDDPLDPSDLSNEALRALEDFQYFRRRYFARTASPWQEQAANQLLELLKTPHKEFVVVNCPPGSGKSTLFAHDVPIWMACQNRAIRCLIGSYTERQAVQYIGRIRRTFTRKTPMEGAESTLIRDFGGFRPLLRDLWRVNEFIIAQPGETDYSEKEPSFAGFGFDSAFLGGRFDLIVWDDLVDKHVLRSRDALEAMEKWFGDEAETRTEPGGLFVLQGQRMAKSDLYRFALDLKLEDGTPKYHHICFKAHDDERCEGLHEPTAPYWPEGCLLDPVRVSWRDLSAKMRNAMDRYQVLFQQEDHDEASSLLRSIWLTGGTEDNVTYRGCLDRNRSVGDLPPGFERLTGVITVDPSASNKWGLIYWLIDPQTEDRYLIDIYTDSMQVSEFLDYSYESGAFGGILERWYHKYYDKGVRLRYLICEVNAAQRWLLQSRMAQQWSAQRSCALVAHSTTIKKNDQDYGVQSLRNLFEFGKIRLPGRGEHEHLNEFLNQCYAFPAGKYNDLVMSAWFLEAQWVNISSPIRNTPTLWTPTWMRKDRRGLTDRGLSRESA